MLKTATASGDSKACARLMSLSRTALLARRRVRHDGPVALRRYGPAAVLALALATSCGGGEMTMTEYVDAIDVIFDRAIARYEVLATSSEGEVLIAGQSDHFGFTNEGMQLTDFAPWDLHLALDQLAEIQAEAVAAANAIDPPDQIEELHALYFRELPIAELATRAATAEDWYELSESDEMQAYRAALAADNEVCAEFQEALDATAARGVFEDVPWIPGELQEIVDYALGCSSLPQHPQDAYRPPPTTTP